MSFVLYRDNSILIANKPSGIPVHETKDSNRENFTSILQKNLNLEYIRTINRLDLETSGIVVFGIDPAKNKEIDNMMNSSEKFYISIVHGNIENKGRIESFLKDGNKKVNTVRSGGKKAITEFIKLDFNIKKNISLLLLKLITGRRHQIRIHLFEKGFPILGEKIYTNLTNPLEKRCLLHSSIFKFNNLDEEEKIIFSNPNQEFTKYFSIDLNKELLW